MYAHADLKPPQFTALGIFSEQGQNSKLSTKTANSLTSPC